MRKNVRQAMDSLFSGKEYTNASIQTHQRGEFWIDIQPSPDEVWPSTHAMEMRGSGRYLPTAYSYGSHFPLVMLDGDQAYVNTKKYSATTSTQQSGVGTYLHYEGYEPTGEYLTQPGFTRFAIYRKVTSERWPRFGNRTNSVWQVPAHHGVQP